MNPRRALGLLALAFALLVTLGLSGATTASAYPPDPPDEATARAHLDELTVATPGSGDDYDRDLFPHWHTVEGTCDTRETVLKRDGTDVSTGDDCYPTDGSWYSVYDGETFTDPSDVHIDHIVPLSEAWKSGANEWTTDHREEFANDLTHSQLIAVSASSNMSKGDDDPAEWKPENENVWCVYSREWIDTKFVYELTVDEAEKAALSEMLDRC
ncbi:HNH endonuclease family protein [Nocardioidaceae bacterium SCSIO 66511]|nr:HNH endonuclease family protein [Nocardioidaceae bacterium SCSIO 66511]